MFLLLTMRFWNNLYQVRLKPKYATANNLKVFGGQENQKGPNRISKIGYGHFMTERGEP
jgi:hypothetical protein